MQKIGDSTSTANANSEFTEGSPAGGVPSTLLKAQWLNTIQRELSGLVTGSGVALNPADDGQVLASVKRLITSAISSLGRIGTAAKADLTLYRTDNTPGRVLQTGDFGLGATDMPQTIALEDLSKTGFYHTKLSLIDGSDSSLSTNVISIGIGQNSGFNLFCPYGNADNRVGFRKFDSGSGWGAPQYFYHSGNLKGATESTLGLTKIASDQLVSGGVDDSSFVTPKKLALWADKFKTAAYKDAATSAYDDTPGRLLKVGSFGLGAVSIEQVTGLVGLQRTGFHHTQLGTIDGSGSTKSVSNITISIGENASFNLFATHGTDDLRVGFRKYEGGNGWGNPYYFYHSGNLGHATEVVPGFALVASTNAVNGGVDDTSFVTPKKLRMGFNGYFSTNGFLIFPTWLGGFIFQWGRKVIPSGSDDTLTYSIPFPNNVFFGTFIFESAATSFGQFMNCALSYATLGIRGASSNGSAYRWFAVGN